MLENGECYEFRDPIHGMICVNELERELINSSAFQRLRNIRQLATTNTVYHGAEHTRFGHSLGVMHIAGMALEILKEKEPLKSKITDENEYYRLKYMLRLAALLHDIGHAPFSHAGEDLFPNVKDVDGSEGTGHEVYTRLIIDQKLSDIINKFYDKTGVKTGDVLGLLKGNTRDNNYRFLYDIISGQLDADKMDYLLRDSHYCGVNYGLYDLNKLLNSLCICESQNGDWQLGILSNGIYSVEEFVYARYWMFLQVYFHKTRRIYDRYLIKFLETVYKKYPDNIDKYLELDDNDVLQAIKNRKDATNEIWAKNLYYRRHLSEAFISPSAQINDDNELDRIAWTIDKFKEDFNYNEDADEFYVDQAYSSTARDLISIPHYISGEAEEEEESPSNKEIKLPAIPVKDKHTHEVKRIQDYSIPLRGISNKRINILRVYSTKEKIDDVKGYCNECFTKGYDTYRIESEKTKQKLEEAEIQYKALQQQVENANKAAEARKSRYNR